MLAVVFDSSFKPLGRDRKKTKGHLGAESGLERIVQTIREAMQDASVSDKQICGIGVGCPGPLDLNRGIILEAPNLGWKDVPIKQTLTKKFGCPAVIVNDVDAGVFGEYRFGAGRQERCVLGLFLGTGIGGGCVYEGKLFRGKTGSCMEIGHVQIMPAGPRSGTGRVGSLEAVASRLAIAAEAAQAAFRGQAPHLHELAGTDISQIRSGTLAAAIKASDRVIEQIVRDAAEKIGVVVAGMINVLAPDVVVLGGGLVEAMPQLFLDGVSGAVCRHVLASYADSYHIVPAELGDEAIVMGAAAWAATL